MAVVTVAVLLGMPSLVANLTGENAPVLTRVPAIPDGGPAGYVVAAYTTSASTSVLDPETGNYRPLEARWSYAATSPDLRYALLRATHPANNPADTRYEYVLYDTTRARTTKNLDADQYPYATWSPDGRHIAFAKLAGANRDQSFVEEIAFLNVTKGTVVSVDVGDVEGVRSDPPLSWLRDGSALVLPPAAEAGADGRYVLVNVSGKAAAIDGWPITHTAFVPVLGSDLVSVWPNTSESREALLIDARAGDIVRRYPTPEVMPDQAARSGPASAVAWLGVDRLIILQDGVLKIHNLATGDTESKTHMPDNALTVHFSPAAGLAPAAQANAIRVR